MKFDNIVKKLSEFNEIIIKEFEKVNTSIHISSATKGLEINVCEIQSVNSIFCCDIKTQPINLALHEFKDYLSERIAKDLYNGVIESIITIDLNNKNILNEKKIIFFIPPHSLPYPSSSTAVERLYAIRSIYDASGSPFFEGFKPDSNSRIIFDMNFVILPRDVK